MTPPSGGPRSPAPRRRFALQFRCTEADARPLTRNAIAQPMMQLRQSQAQLSQLRLYAWPTPSLCVAHALCTNPPLCIRAAFPSGISPEARRWTDAILVNLIQALHTASSKVLTQC